MDTYGIEIGHSIISPVYRFFIVGQEWLKWLNAVKVVVLLVQKYFEPLIKFKVGQFQLNIS